MLLSLSQSATKDEVKFVLELESGGRVEYGWDHALGYFGSLIGDHESELATYDALTRGFDHERPLDGLLRWMATRCAAYSIEDLEEALSLLVHRRPEELPKRLRVVAEVWSDLRAAADCG